MLARLRREFIAITMTLAGLILVVALGSTLVTSYTTQMARTQELLRRALSLDEDYSPLLGDTSGEMAVDAMLTITVEVSFDGDVLARSTSPVQISADTLYDVLFEALRSDQDSGSSSSYPISWMRRDTSVGYRIALADTYSRDASLRSQAVADLVIFGVSMLALYAVVRLLASWALRPVEEAWNQQRRFVSDASHELKTPLAVILANTQILEDDPDMPAEARRWVLSTSEEASHMKVLVEDLLALARADEQTAMGGKSQVREGVDLSALVDSCALEFDAVAFERGCTIESDLTPGICVSGDAAQLERVVRILLDNATKYAETGTAVRVALARDGRRARLAVSNRGEVIDPEDLEHLFDRFYRTDRARERQATGGFGLGLAIAKSLVEAHGGKISATSTATGGTTFEVLL